MFLLRHNPSSTRHVCRKVVVVVVVVVEVVVVVAFVISATLKCTCNIQVSSFKLTSSSNFAFTTNTSNQANKARGGIAATQDKIHGVQFGAA